MFDVAWLPFDQIMVKDRAWGREAASAHQKPGKMGAADQIGITDEAKRSFPCPCKAMPLQLCRDRPRPIGTASADLLKTRKKDWRLLVDIESHDVNRLAGKRNRNFNAGDEREPLVFCSSPRLRNACDGIVVSECKKGKMTLCGALHHL